MLEPMQGVKETGKVMMKQERRCWAQDREEVHRHSATVYQEARSARLGWRGGGCWASVPGFHGPHIAGLCVWVRPRVYARVYARACVSIVAIAEMGWSFW